MDYKDLCLLDATQWLRVPYKLNRTIASLIEFDRFIYIQANCEC